MQIQYIQDMEWIDSERHGDLLKYLKHQKYSSFGFEQRRWSEEPLVFNAKDGNGCERYQCNFVGIIWYENTLILSLPKAVEAGAEGQRVEDIQMSLKYADLLDQYFNEVRTTITRTRDENERKGKMVRNFEPAYPWCIDNLANWCRKMVDSDAVLPVPQVIVAVKFEKVFEWMLGKLFDNQISLEEDRVILKSQILSETGDKKRININDSIYNPYIWEAIGKRNKADRKLESREDVFGDQQKKNIPDIVTEIVLNEEKTKKCCCVMDAKYSGWNRDKNCYKLPGNMDIYKQFFYQEQLLRIYENAGQTDVGIYNFMILPDHMNDTGNKLLRQCAEIKFPYHEEQSIAVLQIDMDALIDICVNDNKALIGEKNRTIACMLKKYKKVVPMRSHVQGGSNDSYE